MSVEKRSRRETPVLTCKTYLVQKGIDVKFFIKWLHLTLLHKKNSRHLLLPLHPPLLLPPPPKRPTTPVLPSCFFSFSHKCCRSYLSPISLLSPLALLCQVAHFWSTKRVEKWETCFLALHFDSFFFVHKKCQLCYYVIDVRRNQSPLDFHDDKNDRALYNVRAFVLWIFYLDVHGTHTICVWCGKAIDFCKSSFIQPEITIAMPIAQWVSFC